MIIVVIQTQHKIVCEQDQEETWAGLLNQGSLPRVSDIEGEIRRISKSAERAESVMGWGHKK